MPRSFYKSEHAPYYIYALDYRQQSAGIRALHYLCHALNESGLEAYVTCKTTLPRLRTPRLSPAVVKRHQVSGRMPIVVYPEVVSGNPLAGRIVVRWLLNRPGHLSGDQVFQDDDLIFTYNLHYLPEGMEGELLHIPTVDLSLFNNDDNPDDDARELVCYYANKYLAKGGKLTAQVKDAVSLCQDQPLTHIEIASILRRAKCLYTYEPTALIAEALLCGCPVSVIQTDYWKANTSNFSYPPDWGVVMDDKPESLALAKANVGNYRATHEEVLREAWLEFDRFVESTQAVAGERAALWRVGQQEGMAEQQAEAEGNSRYELWRAGRAGQNALRQAEIFGADTSAPGALFHLVVFVPQKAMGQVDGTLRTVSNQSYPYWRLTLLGEGQAPEGLPLSAGTTWSDISGSGFFAAANRLASEDTDSHLLVFLEAGDAIEPLALLTLAQSFARHSEWGAAFADEDSLRGDGKLAVPFFKSGFEPERYRAAPFSMGGMAVLRRGLFLELGGLNAEFDGAEFFDLMLRVYESVGTRGMGHVEDVLYHRHAQGGHCALSSEEIVAARKRALRDHLGRIGAQADADEGVLPGTFRIRYRFEDTNTVSIIIPTSNGGAFLQRCIGAVVENTDYKNWELIIVDQGSDDPETLKFLELLPQMGPDTVRVLKESGSASLPTMINAGAAAARGQYLLFLSDAAAPLQRDWLDEMLGYAVQPEVGVVGAKMVGPDASISFAGYVLGLEGLPAGLHDLRAPPDALGYFGALQVPGNPSSVSATCMMTSKALFDELGGFDEQSLAGDYSDVDYCLKSWEAGKRVVWTPFALLLQEHMSEPPRTADPDDEDEEAEHQRVWHMPTPEAMVMFDRWLDRIAFDPAYNRNLSLASGVFEIETHPALTWDPEFHSVPRVLAHTGDRFGSGEYRLIAPLRALGNSGDAQGWDTKDYLSTPELARMSPDVVLFQRQIKPHQIRLIEYYARYSKAFRVFELDDLITNIQIGNQAWSGYQDKDLVKRFRKALDLCDRFVVSTEYLAEEYRKYKADIVVAPNYLEWARWGGFEPKRRQGRKPRVGWAGSVTHDADLVILTDVVKALADEVEWVFFGLCPEGVRPLVEYHSGVTLDEYPARLAGLNLDLALAPLEDVPFNHAKSHLRVLEYGVLGYPVICTDITPYRGAYPVTRIKNRFRDWVDAIREQLSDMNELAERGDALREHVEANWLLEDNLDTWRKAWFPA